MEITSTQWIDHVAEQCNQLMVESTFTANWTIIVAYHTIGSFLTEESTKHKYPQKKLIETVAQKTNKSSRTLYYACAFYKAYPDLDTLPEGKDVSWHKIVNKYLPVKKKDTKKDEKITCPECGAKFLL